MKEKKSLYTLGELCSLVDMPRRTVRYYIQVGLIDRPGGSGRGAHYNNQHLDQLLEVRKWQRAGLSLERIRELVTSPTSETVIPPLPKRKKGAVEVWSHIVIDDGIEITINPKQANLSHEEVRKLAKNVIQLYEKIRSDRENKR